MSMHTAKQRHMKPALESTSPEKKAKHTAHETQMPLVVQPEHSSSSVHSRMHRNELEHLFAFLGTFANLHILVQVCKAWLAAVGSMNAVGDLHACDTPENINRLEACLQSPTMIRLLTRIRPCDAEASERCVHTHIFVVRPSAMTLLAQRATRLRHLECELPPPVPTHFPSRLETARLSVNELSILDCNRLFTALTHLQSLTELELIAIDFNPPLDFNLLRTPQLRSFALKNPYGALDSGQIQALGADYYLQLDVFIVPMLPPDRLVRADQLHRIRWKRIQTLAVLPEDSAVYDALGRLSGTLEYLAVGSCKTLDWFSNFVHLTDLDVGIQRAETWAVAEDVVLDKLKQLHRLRRLCLSASLNEQHMATLLPCLPDLTSLHLYHMSELRSLAFFSSCLSAAHNLREFSMHNCIHVGSFSSALRDGLGALHFLRTLTLVHCFNEALACEQLLQPPTTLFPHLQIVRLIAIADAAVEEVD
jgi:hypothetical protein